MRLAFLAASRDEMFVLALVGLSSCGSKQATGSVLTAAGTAAVVVATAVLDQPSGCSEVSGSLPGDKEVRCQKHPDTKVTRAAVAGAGLGLVAAGTELQRAGFDQASASRPPSRPRQGDDRDQSLTAPPCSTGPVRSVVFLAPTGGAAGANSGAAIESDCQRSED